MQLGVTKDGFVNGIKVDVFGNSGIHPTNEATSYFPQFIDNGNIDFQIVGLNLVFSI